jgi:hypothetical protein
MDFGPLEVKKITIVFDSFMEGCPSTGSRMLCWTQVRIEQTVWNLIIDFGCLARACTQARTNLYQARFWSHLDRTWLCTLFFGRHNGDSISSELNWSTNKQKQNKTKERERKKGRA